MCLFITALPRITEHLDKKNACIGEDVILQCKCEGRPDPVVTWFINATHVPGRSASDSNLFDTRSW